MNLLRDRKRRYKIYLLSSVVTVSIILLMSVVISFRHEWPDSFEVWKIGFSMYGITLLIGIYIAIIAFGIIRPSLLENVDLITASLWVVIPAILLARGWHVATDFQLYEHNLEQALNIWDGGLSIWGAILGGLAGVFIYAEIYGFKLKLSLNYVAVVLPLGQAIGRLSNLFNYELFGPPCDNFWCIYVPGSQRPYNYIDFEKFHPAFFYEAILCLILFWGLLLLLHRLENKNSKLLSNSYIVVALYIIGYGVSRFIVEFYRIENDFVLDFSLNQILSLLLIVSGIGYIIYRFKLGSPKLWKR